VEAFDAMSAHVPRQAVHGPVRISHDLEQHLDWLTEYAELGFDDIYLHHVGQRQQEFIDTFAQQVLPRLRDASRKD
jgi:alkanesulfonate monooxygenase SsuD/methylene tetrahydromethanopterin reductase-like flavin-dependent oxidoreductase (luciferase family)